MQHSLGESPRAGGRDDGGGQRGSGRVTKEPLDAEWGGRSAYFADPEDNIWEIAWVPPDSRMAAAIARACAIEQDAG